MDHVTQTTPLPDFGKIRTPKGKPPPTRRSPTWRLQDQKCWRELLRSLLRAAGRQRVESLYVWSLQPDSAFHTKVNTSQRTKPRTFTLGHWGPEAWPGGQLGWGLDPPDPESDTRSLEEQHQWGQKDAPQTTHMENERSDQRWQTQTAAETIPAMAGTMAGTGISPCSVAPPSCRGDGHLAVLGDPSLLLPRPGFFSNTMDGTLSWGPVPLFIRWLGLSCLTWYTFLNGFWHLVPDLRDPNTHSLIWSAVLRRGSGAGGPEMQCPNG